LSRRVIGQTHAIERIVPYVDTFRAGLSPEGRPAGVFLLLGPTGTGKTKTVEALAEVLHGSERNVLKINCGEFQMDHEVAKLIGAPPGYLGHRETHPMLSQAKLAAVTSERSNLSIVLFDEIEKAAPSLTRLLLGVLDKGMLKLGDNTGVNFERSLIFFTSNLGARGIEREMRPTFGLEAMMHDPRISSPKKLEQISMTAMRKHFPPEFVNRIDACMTFRPLSKQSLKGILQRQIADLQHHIDARLLVRRFRVEVRPSAFRFLLEKGSSAEYGARELKRTMFRHLTQQISTLVADGGIPAGYMLAAEKHRSGETLRLRVVKADGIHALSGRRPVA
jgi:ATP-dependent Clp protease ATP-binding subunit ClpA